MAATLARMETRLTAKPSLHKVRAPRPARGHEATDRRTAVALTSARGWLGEVGRSIRRVGWRAGSGCCGHTNGLALLAKTPGPGHQRLEELPDPRPRSLVGEVPVPVETLRRVRDQNLGPVHRVHVEEHERLAQVVLRAGGSQRTDGRPMTATGLPSQALSPYGREAQSMAFFKTPGTE